MQKKPYHPPTLTEHGSVVKQTKGLLGDCFEPLGRVVDEDGRGGMNNGFTKPVAEK